LKYRNNLKDNIDLDIETPIAKTVVVHFGDRLIPRNERLADLRYFINHEVGVNHSPLNQDKNFAINLRVFSPDEDISSLYSDLVKTEEWFEAKAELGLGNDLFAKAKQSLGNRGLYRQACDRYWQAFQMNKGPFGVKDIQNAYNACNEAGNREKKTVFEEFSSEFRKLENL